MIRTTIQGIQEAQRDNLRMIRALEPRNALGQGVRVAGTEMHRYTVIITHVDTGALRASHRMDYTESGSMAEVNISVSGSSRNPRTGAAPSVYGPAEHARGGTHAFYERTLAERGDYAADLGMAVMMRAL